MAPPTRRLTRRDIEHTRTALARLQADADTINCFVGFDGFIDSIIDAVATRHAPGPDGFDRMTSLSDFARRIDAAAGRSANIELVVKHTRIGGAGPILAGALARLGAEVHCAGAIDHTLFDPLRDACASTVSLGPPGATDAIEFDDGKLMLGKAAPMDRITWDRIVADSGGIDALIARCNDADLIAPCGWTMIPAMNDIWKHLAADVLPALDQSQVRRFFVDFSDPAKRSDADLRDAIGLVQQINKLVPVTLGLNLAEAQRIAGLLAPASDEKTTSAQPGAQPVAMMAGALHRQLGLSRIAVHAHRHAAIAEDSQLVSSPTTFTPTPLISTGAGDHFNAGLCLALAHRLDTPTALACAIATSGLFVRTGRAPSLDDITGFLDQLPRSES